MNFSGLKFNSMIGRLVRLPLRLVPKRAVVPILQGPARGLKWVAGSSNHGCWLGSYELEKGRMLARLVRPGDTAFDIGANVGYYTLVLSKLVGPTGRVVAFEPLPANLQKLRKHVSLNRLENVEIRAAAVTDTPGTVRFAPARSNSMGRVSNEGELVVEAESIDASIAAGALPTPRLLKIDVEGGEADVLAGAARLIASRSATFLIATHSPELHARCLRMMADAGYDVSPIGSSGDELLAVPR